MTPANKKPRVKEKPLMLYVKRNIRLALILSIGALILVFVASSTGGLCYLSSKKSMYLAAKESSVDAVFEQKTDGIQMEFVPHTRECFQIINTKPYVMDACGLAAIPIDLNVTVGGQDKGKHRVLILYIGKKGGFNVALSQGSPIKVANELLVSENFYENFNVTLGESVSLVILPKTPPEMYDVSGYVAGVTPKGFSQLINDLGLHESLILSGYTEATILSFDEYPFVLLDINTTTLQSHFLDYAGHTFLLGSIPATFFVKFDEEAYLNPWDMDITISNLKELSQNLRLDINNLTSARLGFEYNLLSMKAIPAATIFQELSRFINVNKLTVIAFGATVALVGWYFYSSLSQTALSARIKELQLMRTRGVSQKSITRSVFLIVVAAGVTGTTAGLLLGFFLTTSIGSVVLDISITSADVVQTFGVSSLMFYVFFGLAASIVPQRQVLSKVKVIASKEEAGMGASMPMGLMEKLFLTVSLFLGSMKVLSWLLGIDLTGIGQTTNPIVSAIVIFVRLIDQTILDALGGLLLIYALVTIVSKRPMILSTLSQWVSRVVSPRLSMLSKRLMAVKSAKMAVIMVVASLLIFNTVSANMGYRGVEIALKNLSAKIVGADIRIDAPEEASLPIIQLLGNISSVYGCTQILTIASPLGSPLGNCMVYAIDPESYGTILKTSSSGLESITAGEMFVSDFFHEVGLLNIGDTVRLGGEKELVVRKFVKDLPGLLSIPPTERFAAISVASIEHTNYTVISRTLIVRVNGRQPDIVVNELINNLPENVRLKLSVATESRIAAKFGGRMAAPLIVESVMSMLRLASVTGVVFAALALGILGYGEAMERLSLDALLRIRGVTRRQLLGMALSEALCTLALSLIIGFFAGYAMATGYTSYFSAAFPVRATPAPSYELASQLLMLIATYLLAFLVPTLYTWKKVCFHIY